jgi:fructose-1,6-bisphosphatase I
MVLSEEAQEPILLDPDAPFDVVIDPIDGSGSIGTGLPLDLLYAVLPAAPENFARPGRVARAAGSVAFGHSVDMGLSLGDGVALATLDRAAGAFRITRQNVTIPRSSGLIAYNASNVRHWPAGLRAWAADVVASADGPRGRDANMRWLAAAVGELHRILLTGGVFVYPADARPGYARGRLLLA